VARTLVGRALIEDEWSASLVAVARLDRDAALAAADEMGP
jgi:hypothetical protein